ncbi:MAG: T9SS type A sorting domain-containing protein [Leeuwenhoekiella sp.]
MINLIRPTVLIVGLILLPFSSHPQWIQVGNDIDGSEAADRSGSSVSLSEDGDIVAIGSLLNSDGLPGSGEVRVLQNFSGEWEQIGQNIYGETAGEKSGRYVSLNADGTTIAIGAYDNGENGKSSGQVRVYKFINNMWQQIGEDINGDKIGDYAGWSVSLNDDGNILAVGIRGDTDNGVGSGFVRVYRYHSGDWQQIGDDIKGKTPREQSGWDIDLSADGSRVAISGVDTARNDTLFGAIRVYENRANAWIQLGEDIYGENPGDYFGWSISLSEDGNTVAGSSYYNADGGVSAGHARVFRFTDGAWNQMGQDIDGQAGDLFGNSVSLSADGTKIAVGAIASYGNSGHISIYNHDTSANEWLKIGNDIVAEGGGDSAGWSVSLSTNGHVVAHGAIGNTNENGVDSGHVRVFTNSSLGLSQITVLDNIVMHPNPTIDLAYIDLSKIVESAEVQISNVNGKILDEYHFVNSMILKIDLSQYSYGLYFVQLEYEGKKVVFKLLVK